MRLQLMNSLRMLFCIALIAFGNLSNFAQPLMFEKVIQKNEQYYLSNTIIIKLKEKPVSIIETKFFWQINCSKHLGNLGWFHQKEYSLPVE